MNRNTPYRFRRRDFLGMAAPIAAASVVGPAFAAIPTPKATEGPYYPLPEMRYPDADNDLVRIDGQVTQAGGEIIHLMGHVLDNQERPVAGARVEIWQCDVNGSYLHSGDTNSAPKDTAFQGFGHVITGADGAYWFRTIKPVPYPGRTPHIHVKVFAGDTRLTTQFYIAGHPQNASDRLFASMNSAQQEAVSMNFQSGTDGTPETQITIHL